MILILNEKASKEKEQELISLLEKRSVKAEAFGCGPLRGLLLSGDTYALDESFLEGLDTVRSFTRLSEPFKCCGRRLHPKASVINCGGALIGDGNFQLIAGPCTVESRKQIFEIAAFVKKAGASMLRGGAFKPRSSPYSFQGLREEGIKLLLEAKRAVGLPIVTEIMDIRHLPLFEDVDLIQVGARNMQNFELLKELAKSSKPILLKRGQGNTLKELLLSAEYLMSGGNPNVILCERGIRSFESYTRSTLDLSAVPLLHELTHLPVAVDPSHACGNSKSVPPMALAAAAAGADAVMTEVHNSPQTALCDGPQALSFGDFEELAKKIFALRSVLSKEEDSSR